MYNKISFIKKHGSLTSAVICIKSCTIRLSIEGGGGGGGNSPRSIEQGLLGTSGKISGQKNIEQNGISCKDKI